jgi:hypothetical protein
VVEQRRRSLKIPEIPAVALNNVQSEKGSNKDNNSTLVNIYCAASTPTGDSNLEVAGSETSVCDISRNKYGRRSVEQIRGNESIWQSMSPRPAVPTMLLSLSLKLLKVHFFQRFYQPHTHIILPTTLQRWPAFRTL